MKNKSAILRCDCNCCMLIVDKYNDHINVCVQDSYYESGANTVKGRISRAWKALFGKPVSYSDMYIEDKEEFKHFLNECNKLLSP